jgi:hypothetical protein
MTRREELIFRLLDGGLDANESAELEALLADDQGRKESMALLRLEAALRARQRNLEAREEVLAQLQQPAVEDMVASERLRQAVLDRIEQESQPWQHKPARMHTSRRLLFAFGTMATIALALVVFTFRQIYRPDISQAPSLPPAATPVIAAQTQSSPIPVGTTDPPSVWTDPGWPHETAHRVWFVDLGTHALTMATSPDGIHWAPSIRLTGVLPSAVSLTLLYEPGRPDPFRLYYLAKTAAGGEIHAAESADGVNFHNDKSALGTSVSAEGLAVAVLPAPASSYRLYYRDRQANQIVYATSRDGLSFVGVDVIAIPSSAEPLSLRPARFEKAASGELLLWTLDARDRPHLLTSTNGYAWAFVNGEPDANATNAKPDRIAEPPGRWSFFSPMNDWQNEGWMIFSNSGTVPDGITTAVQQGADGTVAVRDRRSWGNFYLTHEAAWAVPFTVEARVRLDDAQGTDGDARFPKFTIACLMRDVRIPGPQTWQPAFGQDRFGAWSLSEGPWAPSPGNGMQTFTVVCRFDPEARRKLTVNPEDAAAKVAVCVFDIYTNRNFTAPALTFHNMGFMGWHSVDDKGRLDIGFPWPSAGQITLDWVRWGNGIILDPADPSPAFSDHWIASPSHKTPSGGWQVADSPNGPWIHVSNLGELAMLAPLGRPKFYRPN